MAEMCQVELKIIMPNKLLKRAVDKALDAWLTGRENRAELNTINFEVFQSAYCRDNALRNEGLVRYATVSMADSFCGIILGHSRKLGRGNFVTLRVTTDKQRLRERFGIEDISKGALIPRTMGSLTGDKTIKIYHLDYIVNPEE